MKKEQLESRQTRCYMDVFHFVNQVPPSGSGSGIFMNIIPSDVDNLKTEKYQLYDDIVSFSYSKSLSSPAGTFQCKILATRDYSKLISPGDWVQIYLTTSKDKKHKRVIGNVDRISLEEFINEDGMREIYFSISGRDFGKIFQDTTIWFNPYTLDQYKAVILNKINKPGGPPNVLIKNIIDLFLNDAESVADCSTSMNYWYIGDRFAQELGQSGHPQFADLIDMSDFSVEQPGFKAIPVLNVQGNVWSVLKGISNEVINTMFTELYENKDTGELLPKLYFGVRPYCFRSFTSEIIPTIQYFLDLPSAVVDAKEIIGASIGLNDHDRLNMFFLRLQEQPYYKSQEAKVFYTQGIDLDSIKRSGLRLFSRNIDYGIIQGGTVDSELYSEYMRLVSTWYKANHLLENGTFTILGNPEIRVGRRLVINNSKMYPNRQYLIESYTDSWSFGDVWRQQVEVTRGITLENESEKYAYQSQAGLFNVSQVSKIDNRASKDLLPDTAYSSDAVKNVVI